MKFEINEREWEIKEVDQAKMNEVEGTTEEGKYFGLTCYEEQVIYLWEKLKKEQKRQTLMHELLHCYIGCYVSFQGMDSYSEDVMCNICANAHDIIHEIVEKYFKIDNTKK